MSAIAPSPEQPVRLVPVSIAKPWGREIWYSAIEPRGESRVLLNGGGVALSHYLDAVGLPTPIVLLKVLDPDPEALRGDLYLEVHREKREVYVVTAVDQQAWPDGRGQIRFGMNQAMRARFADDEQFRAAYLRTVRDYETVRHRIDRREPVSRRQLLGREARARAAMDAFTDIKSLAVGDVVVVPTWTPHALQHGVRVAEFQTPSYERYIISFTQKVLTQDGWDSEKAIVGLSLDPPPQPAFRTLAPGVDSIASFEDFGVWRASVAPGHTIRLPSGVPYALCMTVLGTIDIGPLRLQPEEACLLPKAALLRAAITADDNAQCLIAAPGL